MTMRKLGLFVSLMLALSGCGGGSMKAPSRPSTPSAEAYGGEAPAASPADAASDAASSTQVTPSAPSSDSASSRGSSEATVDVGREAPRDRAERRQGLGTEYGESRTSRVHDVSFVRASGQPFATATFRYNDRRGIMAMTSRQEYRTTSSDYEAGGAVTVSLRDEGGEPLEAMRLGGETYVVGQSGQRYTITLQNHTDHRFEAVATVDGLDVVNGRTGSLDNRGYVLMPYATLEIEGFRQSANAVASFRFGHIADSYAAQKGQARNVGVIGVALFGERGDSYYTSEHELRLRETARPFPADPRYAAPPPRRW